MVGAQRAMLTVPGRGRQDYLLLSLKVAHREVVVNSYLVLAVGQLRVDDSSIQLAEVRQG